MKVLGLKVYKSNKGFVFGVNNGNLYYRKFCTPSCNFIMSNLPIDFIVNYPEVFGSIGNKGGYIQLL